MKVLASFKHKITYVLIAKLSYCYSNNALRGKRREKKATSSVAPAIATIYKSISDFPVNLEMRNKRSWPKSQRVFSNPKPNPN